MHARALTQSKQTHILIDPQVQQTAYDGRCYSSQILAALVQYRH